ncbi:acylneuraminate cytidylyltransferase family protein [Parvularcula dongshanensis]|uniref:CMP-N-acetylneuraminic acid synthetase n=1 Tax=Parvularcula dongshanensis TaxID=1173995 RepID=A0A840I1Q8_9PROT|nr:acylneuraminate cytidylyltransferase family protein [Parvularcula dongshanensis]MBB4658956.1 CMP-N-acetylneuraminic acid synthetase [Parvularcula dongshanensis]
MSLDVTALLPMKANSERVRGKNFRPIAGKPLFRWILDALLEEPRISRVVINTDALSELAAAGLEGGSDERIVLRERRPDLRGDFVSMNLVLQDDVHAIGGDAYFMTHTTNPLLSAATIGDMIDQYEEALATKRADSLFSVNRLQTRFYTGAGTPINHDPNDLIRTQDLEPYFEENSVAYLFSRESFAKTGARIGLKPLLYRTPPLESVDIDERSDWYLAESLLLRGPAPSEALL